MKKKKNIILSLENTDFKHRKRKGVILISSIVLLIIVSILSISIMTVSYNSLSRIKKILDTSEKFYTQRIVVESLFNYTVALLVKNHDGLSWSSSISDDMKDLLDKWKEYFEDKLPGESQKWLDIYNQILSTNQAKDITQSSNFQSFINEYKSYYQNSSFDLDQIIENLKVGVFRVTNTGGGKELILINYGNEFFWAIKIQKTLNQYLFLTNKETTSSGNPIYFVSGDVIDGPLYTTDTIHISGNPVFKGEVIAKGIEQTEGSSPTFENGFSVLNDDENYFTLDEDFANEMMNTYESKTEDIEEILAAPPIEPVGIFLNTNKQVHLDFSYVDSETIKIVVKYNNSKKYEIIYKVEEDGSMTAKVKRRSGSVLGTFPFNGIIYSRSDIYIGKNNTISYTNGLITIVSKGTVYIEGNIVYSGLRKENGDFERNADMYRTLMKDEKNQIMNIVAMEDIKMDDNVPENLYITASVYALTGKFTLDRYDSVKKDRLHLFGAIIQKNRGPIGSFWETCYWRWNWDSFRFEYVCNTYETGFKKHYIYDPRLYDGPYPEGTPSMAGKARIVDIR